LKFLAFTKRSPFIGRPERYEANVIGAGRTYARAAFMDGPYGREHAIAIFRDRALLGLLTPEHAIRISNEIVDAIEELERTGQ